MTWKKKMYLDYIKLSNLKETNPYFPQNLVNLFC